MLAVNKKNQDNSLNIPSVNLFNQVPILSNVHKHRNTFTGKLRPRTMLSSGKGSRMDQKVNSGLSHDHQVNAGQKEQEPSHEQVQGVLHQFDNMQLEDFLKVVIVGKSKLSEAKSKEIIRSLNGTWFKNTDSNSPVSRLYCSLPIKKNKSLQMVKNSDEQTLRKWNFSQHFYKNYTPPNLFPKRRISPSRNRSTFIKPEPAIISNMEIDNEIKTKIASKFASFRQSTQESKRKRRPTTHFSNTKQTTSFKFFEQDNSCLVGKKMVIHD